MDITSVELMGTKVKLIPLMMEHVRGLYAISGHPGIWDYMPTKVNSFEDMHKFVADALAARDQGLELSFAVVDRHTNRVIGTTRLLHISVPNRHLEIGWTWYDPSFWRTRVNTECKYMLLKHAFENLEVLRVQFCADSRNRRSHKAILRLGAVHEGVLRKHRILSDGFVRDTCVYSILDSEWDTVKEKLEFFLNEKYAN